MTGFARGFAEGTAWSLPWGALLAEVLTRWPYRLPFERRA